MWIPVIIFIGWILIGYIANGLSGNILRILLMKKLNLTLKEADQTAEARAAEVTGTPDRPTFWQLLWDDMTWPFCLYYAHKGYRKIIKETKNYENC